MLVRKLITYKLFWSGWQMPRPACSFSLSPNFVVLSQFFRLSLSLQTSNADTTHKQDPNLVIIAPADVLPPSHNHTSKTCFPITVISHEHYCASNHWQLELFHQQLVQAYNRKSIKVIHYWPFVREIHHPLVDFHHKGPVIWTVFHWKQKVVNLTTLSSQVAS